MTSKAHPPTPSEGFSRAAAADGTSGGADPNATHTVEWAVRDREERDAEHRALSWLTLSGVAALTGVVCAVVAIV
jgi:hypothetical protein